MIRIGILGIGFMGATHFQAARALRGGRVVAICTRDPKKRAGDWRSIRGNFGPGGGVQDLRGIRTYADMGELFADPDIDLVDICLPTPLHRPATLAALRAGKHVLLEKPIAISLRAADEMLAAARRARRLFFVAQVLRFMAEFRYLRETVAEGRYGRLKALQLKRIISVPDWGSWQESWRDSGGPAIDLHIHDTDFVHFLFGRPRAVSATGVLDKAGELALYVATHYHFDRRDQAVSAYSGAVATPGIPFEHGFDAYFERATVAYNSTHCPRLIVVDDKGRKSHPRLHFPPAFTAELQEAVDCVARGRPSRWIAARSARDSLATCLAEIESIRRGRTVRCTAD